MKKRLVCAALLLGTTTLARADDVSDLRKQQQQLIQQNKVLMQKLAEVEKRQKKLETKVKREPQAVAQAQAPMNAAQAGEWMAADLARRIVSPTDASTLTFMGITLYGGIDVGATYQSHGTPLSQFYSPGLEYLITKNSNHTILSFAPDALSQSNVGLKGIEPLYGDLSAIFNLQLSFNPQSGFIPDNIRALTQENGVPNGNQVSGGDSSRAGQALSNAYAGLSSPRFGTLTYGRQNALTLDGVLAYDPLGGANAFSVIGYQGATAGFGDTENARLDNSIKYRLNYGPFRVAGMYKFASASTPDGQVEEGQAGFDFKGFSFDGIFTHASDAVAASALSTAATQGGINAANIPALLAGSTGVVNATISDNVSYMLLAKYTFNQFKFYAGYENIRYMDPSDPIYSGQQTIGGYALDAVNNRAYDHNKILQIMWGGVKYSIRPDIDVSLAYYHEIQNSSGGVGSQGAASNLATFGCATSAASNCSGTLDAVSGLIDYRITKRFDVYAGAMWSAVHNGMASGYNPAGTATVTQGSAGTIDPTVGARFQF